MSDDTRFQNKQRWLRRLLCEELGTEQLPGAGELAVFQQTGWVAVEAALSTWGGALLADEVGLGKTHVALAVLEARPRGLVVAPASLLGMWETRLAEADLLDRVDVLSHTALALGTREIADLPSVVVVDEAHAFTNPQTRRYRALSRLALSAPVLLLSATPFGIHSDDLLSLLRLFLPPGSCRSLLGTTLEAWLKDPKSSTVDWPFLLRRIIIRRSRSFLRRHWPGGLPIPDRNGGTTYLTFPERIPVQLSYNSNSPARPGGLTPLIKAIAALSDDVLGAPPGLIKTMLLLRLESSPEALDRSLGRIEGYIGRLLEASETERWLTRRSWRQLFGGLDADVDRQQVFPFMFNTQAPVGSDVPSSKAIAAVLSRVHQLRADLEDLKQSDPKFEVLRAFVESAVVQSEVRIVVFTRFIDTAQGLFQKLSRAFPGVGIGLIHGRGACYSGQAGAGYVERRIVLDKFMLRGKDVQRQIRILVATDVLSEGTDIQACGSVVSYDLPWNPRRLIQRFGRLDRLGREPRRVQTVWIAPERDLEALLGVMTRLTERLSNAAAALGEHEALDGWIMHEAAPVSEPEALVLGPRDDVRLDTEFLMRSDLIALGAGDGGDVKTLGWRMSAAPRTPAGTLFVIRLGVLGSSLWWTFVPDADGAAVRHDRASLYPRLRGLLRRPAEPIARPPARALRLALTDALRQRQKLWSATLQPLAHPPGSAPARLLRRLSVEVLPELSDTTTLKARERLLDLLSGPVPAGLTAVIEQGLSRNLETVGWLTLLKASMPMLQRSNDLDHGEIELLGFVVFGASNV